jgi:hypothetical protein
MKQFLARVKQLIDEILFDADVARQHVRNEAIGQIVLLMAEGYSLTA